MVKYMKYIICVIIFLLIGELIHNYVKSLNKYEKGKEVLLDGKEVLLDGKEGLLDGKELFTNYNELPHLIDLSKSNYRYINNDTYNPDINLQPIILKSKIPVLSNGDLPKLGYYIDNKYANVIIVKMVKKYVIPISEKSYNTSLNILDDLLSYNLNLGIVRDYEVINHIKEYGNNDIKVICPLIYETLYMIKKESLNLKHFQYINTNVDIVKIFTILNDKPILDLLILYLNIDVRKLEINVLSSIDRCISSFILEEKSILFICCHFKNGYLQALLKDNKCYVLDYIPTITSLMEIGNYSKTNPINDDALDKIRKHTLQLINNKLHTKIYYHNLSKNNILSENNNDNIYETFNIRNSLYIYEQYFTEYQQDLLSKNIIKYYQTCLSELNKWNVIPELNNIDNNSLDFLNLSNVHKLIMFNDFVKKELININMIKIKKINKHMLKNKY
jgi:hypothetical protein